MQQLRRSIPILFAALVLSVACFMPALAFAQDDEPVLTTGKAGTVEQQASGDGATVSYKAHIRSTAWQSWKTEGAQAGTGSQSQPIDAFAMRVKGKVSGGIQYQACMKGIGWLGVEKGRNVAGKASPTTGVQALRVALTGQLSRRYDVLYRVKTQSGSWSGWASNGAVAGKAGSANLVTAYEVKLAKKGSVAASAGNGLVGIRYRVKLTKLGWQSWAANSGVAGKSGKNVTRVGVRAETGTLGGGVKYQVRLTNGKWTSVKKNGALTTPSKNVAAIRIKLYGGIAKKYDVVYKTKVQNYGWRVYSINNGISGVKGKHLRVLKVKLCKKGTFSGWVCNDTKWRYYKNGKPVKGKWIKTSHSPISRKVKGTQYYWIDNNGYLAVKRFIKPSKSIDKGAGFKAYASADGYILRSTSRWIGKGWYTFDGKGQATLVEKRASKYVERYVKWAISIANGSSHGYSQYNRWGPDYDCSSLVVSALAHAGFEVGEASWTGNMVSELTKYGFVWHTDLANRRRGDILLVHNSSRQHTEIYLGNNMTVGAHIAENGTIHGASGDQTGHEIDVGPYYSIWAGYLRFGS